MSHEFKQGEPVQYFLNTGSDLLPMNGHIGKKINLKASGSILCLACGRKTSKSFNQGYCYLCMQSLAQCDRCIVKPELCHFHRGTCREPKWGEQHCMIPHLIYLANSSGIKVGITRAHQAISRWIDQGAVQAIGLAIVQNRLDSGLIELALKEEFPDKTNWRTMLKGGLKDLNMASLRDEAASLLPIHPFAELQDSEAFKIEYPVLQYPEKIQSFNFDKNPLIEGTLLGIKGQYLIFDTGVINLRSYGGYEIEFNV
ncbi:MAG: DUF2797 domain-containing protein [Proteobacteria bacterium]|nr:DUF2797 domain-containing protein [Pseudomonadota bacterium]